jgi:Thioredoxin like C-terminal domain
VSAQGRGVEAEADRENLRTPETYLGYERSEHFASPAGPFDDRRAYEFPERLRLNHWALSGEWTVGPENVVVDRAGARIAYRFHARDAHLVLSGGAQEPIPFRVLVDGGAPGASRGMDVDEDGNGVLRDGRLYQLVREHDAIRDRTLEITFLKPRAEAYVFTFG